MGADVSSARLTKLTEMGFTVAESRLALEATSGNVEAAAEILLADRRERERRQGGALAARVNSFLRTQQPWNEFFGRFLWPEHLNDRVSTNLLYYRANYALICAGIVGVTALVQTRLLVLLGSSLGLFYCAAEWNGQLPSEWSTPPLRIEQRLSGALFCSMLLVQWCGVASTVSRLTMLCGGLVLGHATFRARSLASRWAFFKETVEKQD